MDEVEKRVALKQAQMGNVLSYMRFQPTDVNNFGLSEEEARTYLDSLWKDYYGPTPLEYEAFLRFFNGGYSDKFSSFGTDVGDRGYSQVKRYSRFFGFYENKELEGFDVRTILNITKDYVPQDMFPIANIAKEAVDSEVLCYGPYGRIYTCKNLRKKELKEKLQFETLSKEEVEEPSKNIRPCYGGVTLVASSLNDFFKGCSSFGMLYEYIGDRPTDQNTPAYEHKDYIKDVQKKISPYYFDEGKS